MRTKAERTSLQEEHREHALLGPRQGTSQALLDRLAVSHGRGV